MHSKTFLSYAAAHISAAVIAGSLTAAVGVFIMVAVALLTVGIIIRRKRMKQMVLTREHYQRYVGRTQYLD